MLIESAHVEDGPMFTLANDLRLACQRIARRVRFESTSAVAPHQFSVLVRLNRLGPQTPTQLAAHDRVSAPSMTRTVNCLAEEGLVKRSPHPDDGRQVLVSNTERGAAVVRETIAHRDTWMLEHLDGMAPDQLALLRQAADLLLEVSEA
ncbi:DNA-binding transcriptional regulator, MarR family [Tessaracoccus bendigoensis DSM 12906]|uniref:DNA-binding transcriptional regulator, MarR family n=1 Tax=Tessaracoccus bendigoensis DSM 12906 TaxID=1123357 RepID=A0A1M6GN07_9ACTN|nr:MarR family transcriptional regulator [Tessaracoccus bendigoensis]SHJ11290.1 DNA-binding transcriptional regulator, MarR family [Tessaracoccus bendigoensis DSM 12906]